MKKSVYSNVIKGLSVEFQREPKRGRYLNIVHIGSGGQLGAPHRFNRTYKDAMEVISKYLGGLDWSVCSSQIVNNSEYSEAYKELIYNL